MFGNKSKGWCVMRRQKPEELGQLEKTAAFVFGKAEVTRVRSEFPDPESRTVLWRVAIAARAQTRYTLN